MILSKSSSTRNLCPLSSDEQKVIQGHNQSSTQIYISNPPMWSPEKKAHVVDHIKEAKGLNSDLLRPATAADLVTPDVPPLEDRRGSYKPNPVFVDTISLSGKLDDLPCNGSGIGAEFVFSDEGRINWINRQMNKYLGLCFGGEHVGKKNGYQNSRAINYSDGRPQKSLGYIAWGGTSQKGSFQLYLTGEAYEYINATGAAERLYSLAVWLGLKITRIDVAWDDLLGKYSIERIMDMYRNDDFKITKNPKIKYVGTPVGFDDADGRTVYIGNRSSGKLHRSYEKGKQQGDPDSPWVRHEVEFKSKDRVIPLDAILKPHQYFAGAFPALESFGLSTVAQAIATIKRKAEKTIQKTKDAIKKQYGRTLAILAQIQNPVDLLADLVSDAADRIPTGLIFPLPVPSVSEFVEDAVDVGLFGLMDKVQE